MESVTLPIRKELEIFEARLDLALRADVELAHEIARYMATLQGKRLRPVLALLATKAIGAVDDRVIDAAVAVEMIHAATMVHDDVVDSAAMRRGKASVNARWSGQLAVLIGDFLLARALGILIELGDLEALQAMSQATQRLSIGEIFEIQIGTQRDTREDSYFKMVSDKTASLISAATRIGPLLSGAPPQIVAAMGRYGESLGKAFQIADDILDFTGNADTMGKPVGLDLREGKITLPLIHALAAAPKDARRKIEKLLHQDDRREAEWERIVDFVSRYGGVAAASSTARAYADQALGCLEALPCSCARTALQQAVKLVVEREH